MKNRRPLPTEALAQKPELLEPFVDGVMLYIDREYANLCDAAQYWRPTT